MAEVDVREDFPKFSEIRQRAPRQQMRKTTSPEKWLRTSAPVQRYKAQPPDIVYSMPASEQVSRRELAPERLASKDETLKRNGPYGDNLLLSAPCFCAAVAADLKHIAGLMTHGPGRHQRQTFSQPPQLDITAEPAAALSMDHSRNVCLLLKD
ncbi:unnamed protein product [Boreogadus saida]